MSAFQAYGGAYEHDGGGYSWSCYATTRVYEIRRREHAPLPKAPNGRKWIAPVQQDYEDLVACLVDEAVEQFSQILLQVKPQQRTVRTPARREAEVASAAA